MQYAIIYLGVYIIGALLIAFREKIKSISKGIFCILFIASTCIGCAGTMSGYEGKGGPFKIQTLGRTNPSEYFILSIRDSGLVIAHTSHEDPTEFEIESAQFLHKDSILTITHRGLTGMNTIGALVGGTSGLLIGGAFVAAGAEPKRVKYSSLDDFNDYLHGKSSNSTPHYTTIYEPMKGAGAITLISGVLGTLALGYAAAPQSSFSLSIPNDKEKLIALCKYCGHEPDYINAIK